MLGLPKKRRRRRARKPRWLRPILWTAVGLAGVFTLYVGALYTEVTERFEGKRWSLPSKVYSDSFRIHPGMDFRQSRLLDRLARLDYRAVSHPPARPGEYRVSGEKIEIFLHDFEYPDAAFEGFLVRIALEQERIARITRWPEGTELSMVELEPELLAAFFDQAWEERELVRLGEVPAALIEAVLTAEDRRFYSHVGVDPKGLLRAAWTNLQEGEIVQGGSTLTQQLVKNFFLSPERTFRRKINEALMAFLLELRYTKDEILEAYLNEIYLGQNGAMGIYGVGQAAHHYFGKEVRHLSLGESALLAGLIKSPNLYSPFRDPQRARSRRDLILRQMLETGKITAAEYIQAAQERVPDRSGREQAVSAPYFVDYIRHQLLADYGMDMLTSAGLRIFTTLDTEQQRRAEQAVGRGLSRLERHLGLDPKDPSAVLQGCLVAIEPQTGYIRAMVGGRDYRITQFNRVFQARRQPGSLFKPLVFAAAFRAAGKDRSVPYTPATLIEDEPITLMTEAGPWTPQNYDQTHRGTVTLRTVLEQSLNVPTVRLANAIGLERIIETSRLMGIESPMLPVPSLALGTSEVTPLEIATAYAAIANGGMRVRPLAIRAVVAPDGRVLDRKLLRMDRVLSPQQAYLLTHLLKGVVERGTAKGALEWEIDRPIAGKTGTTSGYRDAWFVGFTADLLALTWVGFDRSAPGGEPASQPRATPIALERDRGVPVPLTGSRAALPIWGDFMQAAARLYPRRDFAPPSGVVFKEIDPRTGLLAGRQCPDGIHEAFVEGTEPRLDCEGQPPLSENPLQWIRRWLPFL